MSGVTQPVKLQIDPAAGLLWGGDGRYEKRLGELDGVFQDDSAYAERVARRGADELVYWVESNDSQHSAGGLITGLSVLEPGTIGDEFFMTRGHLHADADCGETYLCLRGRGVMLLETLDEQSQAVGLAPGEAVYVPGGWIHRSVNVGDERFVTLFCYPALAGQDYGVIRDAGGMSRLIVTGREGWRAIPNPAHTGYRVGA